jgi:transmembrane sensor
MTGDYSTFDIEDFASDDSFKNWVLQPDAINRIFWENYLQTFPHQTPKVLAAKQLILDLRESQKIANDPLIANLIWQNIQSNLPKKSKIINLNATTFRVAASVALLIGCWFGYQIFTNQSLLSFQTKNKNLQNQDIEEVNNTGNIMRIHLSDGSTVSLEKNSRLRYSQDFNTKTRIVYLQGEAFFDIAKNPEKPFLVFANEIVTKVLGTSFRIKAYENDKNVSVSVRTGRVSVFPRKEFDLIKEKQNQTLSGLVLTPNQEAIYQRTEERLNKALVENPVLINNAEKKHDFTFENTPINKVFSLLENAYGVDIVFDEEVFKNCSLTVGLEDEELFEKLKVICKTIGASYQVIDSQIVINGRGC